MLATAVARRSLASCLLVLVAAATAAGQGIIIPAGGASHRGMAGTSTAAPLSALGALYWNPATISGLESSEVEVGVDIVHSNHRVSSMLGPFAGSTEDDPGPVPLPNIGWVQHTDNPDVTLGLSMNSVAGFKTNLQVDPSNPVLAPPAFGGLGRVSSEAMFFQISPVASVCLNNHCSVSAGPVLTLGQLSLEPLVTESPNADGRYPTAQASRYHWGGGFQAGVYYIHNYHTHLGASIKSPTWMERFRMYSSDANGLPRTVHADLDLPLIVSLGAAYSGVEDYVFAVDLRYIDYANTDVLGDPAVYDDSNAIQGVDWSSIFALTLGVQRRLNDMWVVRAGYGFNQNPIRDSESLFNMSSPLIYQHLLNIGASWEFSERGSLNIGYAYALPNEVTGPIVLPQAGAIPGSSVQNELDAHLFGVSVTMRQ